LRNLKWQAMIKSDVKGKKHKGMKNVIVLPRKCVDTLREMQISSSDH